MRNLNAKSSQKIVIEKTKRVYGFLFLGYLRRKYWWELIILARKVFILANLVWLNQISTTVQALSALFFLIYTI